MMHNKKVIGHAIQTMNCSENNEVTRHVITRNLAICQSSPEQSSIRF